MERKRRENWIDIVKCIAIIVVLLNHSGLQIPFVNFYGGMFYVPVFFVLSGYTYQRKEERFTDFVKQKAKRLLVPYLVVNLCLVFFFFIKNDVLTGNVSKLSLEPLIGVLFARNQLLSESGMAFLEFSGCKNHYFLTVLNSPTWFLPAMFLAIVVFDAIFRLVKEDMKKIALVSTLMVLCAIIYHYLVPFLLPFSLDSLAYFVVFIAFGYYMKTNQILERLEQHLWSYGGLFLLFIILATWNGSANFSVGFFGKSIGLAMANAIFSSLIIMDICRNLEKQLPKVLSYIGRHTLAIMNWHLFVFMFGTYAIVKVTELLGVDKNSWLQRSLILIMIVSTLFVISVLDSQKEKLSNKWKEKRKRNHA